MLLKSILFGMIIGALITPIVLFLDTITSFKRRLKKGVERKRIPKLYVKFCWQTRTKYDLRNVLVLIILLSFLSGFIFFNVYVYIVGLIETLSLLVEQKLI